MSLLRRDNSAAASLIPSRVAAARPGRAAVTSRSAMQQSVIWAGMNIHAALESMMPVDTLRVLTTGERVSVANPPVLVNPSTFAEGHPDTISDWLYASRMSMQGWGNSFGEITARDKLGLPSQIQLIPADDVVCKIKNYRIVEYRFGKTVMDPSRVWHERANLLPGIPVGLSPFAYAMLAIETASSARTFAADWFGNSAFPGGHMKNTAKVLTDGQSDAIKARFASQQQAGGLLVTGQDWTFTAIQAKAAEAGFIEAMAYTDTELCRYMNVPANVVDVAVTGGATINYANITQKNLDFMVSRMGPNLKRRDDALTTLTPRPRIVRLNRAAFLAMDPATTAELMKVQIESRTRTPSELRRLEDKPEYTEADYAEFDRLFGSKNQTPTPKGIPA